MNQSAGTMLRRTCFKAGNASSLSTSWQLRGRYLVPRFRSPTKSSRRHFSRSPWSPQDDTAGSNPSANNGSSGRIPTLLDSMISTAINAIATGVVISIGGYSYYRYYKNLEFRKMEAAFAPGDPVLDLIEDKKEEVVEDDGHWILREQQDRIDRIVSGRDVGHYFLIVGEKGTGKTSMILKAMQKIDGEGVAFLEAHADPEVFRIRLGKALNFEFKEDYIGGLFSIRGPRDTTALLDIERAFNKLEKVALKRRKEKKGGPLLMIINGMHLLRDDEEGRDILELMQQRAEQWAAANLVTIVLNSDDYWVYERLKQYATRMQVIQVVDLPKDKAIDVLTHVRARKRQHALATGSEEAQPPPSPALLDEIYYHLGGRLSFLGQVAKEQTNEDMLAKAKEIRHMEKAWLLSQCWILGSEMDDDVMDEQKYSAAALVLAKALVGRSKEAEQAATEEEADQVLSNGSKPRSQRPYDPVTGHHLPQMPLHEARQVMTRADFVKAFDHINIVTIDSAANVRADSVPMMHAFREICGQPGFDEHLQATLDRIAAIESLGRTRELLLKGLSEGDKPGFDITVRNSKGQVEKTLRLSQE